MSAYRLAVLAESDLTTIADYTTDRWGPGQAERYLERLAECFERIALTPGMGRPFDSVYAGVRRLEHGRHVVFYIADEPGILIVRVLHQRMLPGRHVLLESAP